MVNARLILLNGRRQNMEAIIRELISKIPSGVIFDTHTFIECLLQNDTDTYLSSFTSGTTETYHGHIGKLIDSFDGTFVDRAGKSWSMNIRKNFSECTCWKKK
jgi:hypothetical protein